MPPVVNTTFKVWLKGSVNIKLSSDAAVTCVTYECITCFSSLREFNKISIWYLPRTCKEKILNIAEVVSGKIAAEAKVAGVNVGSISVRRLIVVLNVLWCYCSINFVINTSNMHYTNAFSKFKIEK